MASNIRYRGWVKARYIRLTPALPTVRAVRRVQPACHGRDGIFRMVAPRLTGSVGAGWTRAGACGWCPGCAL